MVWADRNETGIMAYLAPGRRGRNVFKLTDGSFTEDQPSDMTTVAILYHGGHVHEVSGDELTDLETAGYEDYISEYWKINGLTGLGSGNLRIGVSRATDFSVGDRIKVSSSSRPYIAGEYVITVVSRADKSLFTVTGYNGPTFDFVAWDGVTPLGYVEALG